MAARKKAAKVSEIEATEVEVVELPAALADELDAFVRRVRDDEPKYHSDASLMHVEHMALLKAEAAELHVKLTEALKADTDDA